MVELKFCHFSEHYVDMTGTVVFGFDSKFCVIEGFRGGFVRCGIGSKRCTEAGVHHEESEHSDDESDMHGSECMGLLLLSASAASGRAGGTIYKSTIARPKLVYNLASCFVLEFAS